MSIQELPSGKFRVRVKHQGREIYTRVHPTRQAAVVDEADWLRRLARGSYVDPRAGNVPVSHVVAGFLATREKSVAPKTFTTERYLLGLVSAQFGRLPVGMVEALDVEAELQRVGERLARSSVDRFKSCLSMVFRHAIKMRLRESNPVLGVATPQGRVDAERAEMWPFTLDELRSVTSDLAAVHPDGDLALFLGLTGLRFGEAAALRRKDILEVPHKAARVTRSAPTGAPIRDRTKTGKDRVVPLVSDAYAVVARRMDGLGPDDLIFTTQGRRLGGWAWKCRVHWAEHAQGRRVHDLRHTAATLWLASGVDVKTVQAWLGHATATMTLDRYAHYMPGAGLAAVERMEDVLRGGTAGAKNKRSKGGRRAQ